MLFQAFRLSVAEFSLFSRENCAQRNICLACKLFNENTLNDFQPVWMQMVRSSADNLQVYE